MSNEKSQFQEIPPPSYTLHARPPLLPFLSDLHISLAVRIIIHWILSGSFSFLETYEYCQQYRLNTLAEEKVLCVCTDLDR